MVISDIITIPNPILRTKSRPITTFDQDLTNLAEAMITSMIESDGVGLAANQIDLDQQIFVYGYEAFTDNGHHYAGVPYQAIINPQIEVLDQQTEEMEEGCLSIPRITAPVNRPYKVRLHALDLTGQPIIRDITGYEARVVQHETDHLNGILFLDHVTDPNQIRRQ